MYSPIAVNYLINYLSEFISRSNFSLSTLFLIMARNSSNSYGSILDPPIFKLLTLFSILLT